MEEIILGNNQIQDFSPLDNLIKLKKLNLYGCNIDDIEFLNKKQFNQIENLELANNKINDCSILYLFSKLKYLSLCNNLLCNIDWIVGCTDIEELNLGKNLISDFSNLKNLKKLKKLNLSQCCTNDSELNISFLADDNFKNLIELNISNNYIKDASVLQNLIKLEKLNISHNNISTLQFLLNENSCLIELNFFDNNVNDFSILVSLIKLEVVYYGKQNVIFDEKKISLNNDIIKGIEKNLRKCKEKRL